MKRDCTTCRHGGFKKNKAGRRNLDYGECLLSSAKIPECYRDYSGKMPNRRHISKWSKPDCPEWRRKDASP